jgi:RNA ligase
MSFYLPDLNTCFEIVKNSTSFRVKEELIDGKKVYQFSYMLATPQDFSIFNAQELRGLTFVENGSDCFSRFLHLHKFFNLNETDGYQYHELKNKNLLYVVEKLDGSMIRFVPVNGNIRAKTKLSFESDPAKNAQIIFENNPNVRAFVEQTISDGKAAIFEYCAPGNQIVIYYDKPSLTLIQMRDETTGEYLDIYNDPYATNLITKYDIPVARRFDNMTLDHLINQSKTLEGVEGWILVYSDQLVKLKTSWYFERHRLISGSGIRENDIIRLVLEEKIDDLMNNIPNDQTAIRDYVTSLWQGFVNYFNTTVDELHKLLNDLRNSTNSRKEFAEIVMKDYKEYSPVLFGAYENGDEQIVANCLKNMILKKTYRLEQAKEFLKKNNIEYETFGFVC